MSGGRANASASSFTISKPVGLLLLSWLLVGSSSHLLHCFFADRASVAERKNNERILHLMFLIEDHHPKYFWW